MSSRLAACESCRKAKLACDHKRPACTRCKNDDRAGVCIYRVAPFRRKKATDRLSPRAHNTEDRSPDTPQSSTFSPRLHVYPNPGYLGSSSHATIFDQISTDCTSNIGHNVSIAPLSATPFAQAADDDTILSASTALRHIMSEFQLTAMIGLVKLWLAIGANLALAEPFVEPVTESVPHLFASASHEEKWHLGCAKLLLGNSSKPLKVGAATSFHNFLAQMLDDNFRWESLGIFFLAVGRASIDIAYFPSLYMNMERRYTLRKLATKLSDHALNICLSLDCLNDIQLVLQYENFIMHSFVDGDHSYQTWRKMGDVISSIYALGYHEDVNAKKDVPLYLTQLRKTTFARIYSADKNVAIFLGRPPRMARRFSCFQIPSSFLELQQNEETWSPEAQASYTAETRWSALCASLKEEILELARGKNKEACALQISDIQFRAEAQWHALPSHFQLCEGRRGFDQWSPFERDFLISTRLNHLHVLFLLRLVILNTLTEPDSSIVGVAGEMLSLVVELIMIRDQIVNSGTSIIWKIAHYGLPAAGMIVLAMLKRRNTPQPNGLLKAKILQDLGIYVAGIQKKTIVGDRDPIYVLLSRATETIQKLLDSFHNGVSEPVPGGMSMNENQTDDWAALLGQDIWDFETVFWQHLAGHPSLAAFDSTLGDMQA